jgi:hypothetical protein
LAFDSEIVSIGGDAITLPLPKKNFFEWKSSYQLVKVSFTAEKKRLPCLPMLNRAVDAAQQKPNRDNRKKQKSFIDKPNKANDELIAKSSRDSPHTPSKRRNPSEKKYCLVGQ